MTDEPIAATPDSRNPEDYTDSLCWLLPKGEYTIIDVDAIPLMERHAWRVNYQGQGRYPRVVATINGQRGVFLHRLIAGAPPDLMVDHRNRNTRDQRVSNLRLCSARQNVANSGSQRNTSSRFRGVSWSRKDRRWKVMVTSPAGKRTYLGGFDCEAAAAGVFNLYALDMHGEFAYQNPV